ncbi:MAG: hypothetical protein ACOH1H_03985 [Brevundimonas sp.]
MIDIKIGALFPLLGFSAGILDGAVALRLDFATTREGYAAHQSHSRQFVMTPEAAMEVGRALMERGELARQAGRT